MAESRVVTREIDRPRRWDLPFSRDLPNPDEQRDMTDQDVDRLLSVAPFASMNPKNFPKNQPLRGILQNDTRIRHYRPGDVVVRQGDYGNSAFLILRGSVRPISGLSPEILGRRQVQRKNWFRSLTDLITNPKSPEVRDITAYPGSQKKQPQEKGENVFVQNVTNIRDVLRHDESDRQLLEADLMREGQLFGELAALGRVPRAATVVAMDADTELLEIRWQGLRDIRKYDAGLRTYVDDNYRKFSLQYALLATPLLARLTDEVREMVAKDAEFETYGTYDWYGSYQNLRKKDVDPLSEEPIIAQEGHYPNGLILVRTGFARLSRKHGNGEITERYLGSGDVYGLADLAHNAKSSHQVPFLTTLRALGFVDVIRIPTKTFEQYILPNLPDEMVPKLPASFISQEYDAAGSTSLPNATTEKGSVGTKVETIDPTIMELLVENRFVNGTSTMMIDLDRCTRCDACVHACASGHNNNPRFIRHGAILGHYMVANACMHCVDPVCMIGCPTGAIHRSEEGGEVVINDMTCIGCGICAASCPYDNIRMVEVRDQSQEDAIMVDPEKGKPIIKATKCDLCIDHYGGPACQRACPHDALQRVDMRNMESLVTWLNR